MKGNLAYLYLLSPLHTGGTSQEGNQVGIAREAHTDFPYLPSSSIRGRLRAATPKDRQNDLWGNTIAEVTGGGDDNLKQGKLWIGDGAILWFPVSSLSHGIVWVTSRFLLRRWLRSANLDLPLPPVNSFAGTDSGKNLYLRDAIFEVKNLSKWDKNEWKKYIPKGSKETETISSVLVLPERDCQVLIQGSLWRQVRVNLNEQKSVEGGFRYEESVPPETLMYFPWGTNTALDKSESESTATAFQEILKEQKNCQLGGQESLGRGFVELWSN